ncbi:MAG: tetratricopeptide repeat protein, partial [Candidatus Acidiferrales bacterium]
MNVIRKWFAVVSMSFAVAGTLAAQAPKKPAPRPTAPPSGAPPVRVPDVPLPPPLQGIAPPELPMLPPGGIDLPSMELLLRDLELMLPPMNLLMEPLPPIDLMDSLGPLMELQHLESLDALKALPRQIDELRLLELEALPAIDAIPPAAELQAKLRAYESLQEPYSDLQQDARERDQEARERAKERDERDRERAEDAKERERDRRERITEMYDDGLEALDENRWDRAIERFTRVIDNKAPRADGALYWKAYAQYRKGEGPQALATLQQLQQSHPQSQYVKDAKQLEADIKQSGGQAMRPEDLADEELKDIALRNLIHMSDDEAVPILEKFLQDTNSPRLKKRALFVLAQKGTPRSRDALAKVARGESNP